MPHQRQRNVRPKVYTEALQLPGTGEKPPEHSMVNYLTHFAPHARKKDQLAKLRMRDFMGPHKSLPCSAEKPSLKSCTFKWLPFH